MKVGMPFSVSAPSVAQQHPDNQFFIQKRGGLFNKQYKSGDVPLHFDKKYKYGDAAKRYPLAVPYLSIKKYDSGDTLQWYAPSALIKHIEVGMPCSGRDI
jgi:hypothetical protein